MTANHGETEYRSAEKAFDTGIGEASDSGEYSLRKRLLGGCLAFTLLMMMMAGIAVTGERSHGKSGLSLHENPVNNVGERNAPGLAFIESSSESEMAAVLMAGLTLAFILWLLLLFKEAVFQPLRELIRAGGRLMERQLGEAIYTPKNREFAEMGEIIRDLAADLQEVILCIRTTSAQINLQLEAAKRDLTENIDNSAGQAAMGRIGRIEKKLENLNSLIADSRLFDVHILETGVFQAGDKRGMTFEKSEPPYDGKQE